MEGIVFPIANLLLIAALTEACVETTKSFITSKLSDRGDRILAFIFAFLLSLALEVSILGGTGAVYLLGVLLSAAIISRGSNYIHDFATMLENITLRTRNK